MTYDASGNLTYDTFHTYTWNEFNKLATIDSTACGTHGQCVTYDALGRAVETSNGAAYTEIWYTQLGKTAYMNGSTLKYAYWSGPGGGTLFQPNGNNYWEHKDWLGNARVSSGLGTTIIDDRAFAPYGEMYDNFGSTSANELIFTGDLSNILPSVLYDTENRELNPSQGRWLSPDPALTGWNQYAYGTDPNTQTDPTGMWITGGYQLLNEGMRGPFNAGMEIFPGQGQGYYNPVPAAECPPNCGGQPSGSSLFVAYNPALWRGSGAPDGTASLNINVVYDSAANDGKGLTDDQKKEFQAVLDKALKDFSGMGIDVKIEYSSGSLTVSDGKAQVTGTDSASWNIIVSDKTLTGSNETGYDPRGHLLITDISTHHLVESGLFPFSQNSVEHEFSHIVNGDILRQPSAFRQVLGELPIDTTVMLNRWGFSNSFKAAASNGFPFQ